MELKIGFDLLSRYGGECAELIRGGESDWIDNSCCFETPFSEDHIQWWGEFAETIPIHLQQPHTIYIWSDKPTTILLLIHINLFLQKNTFFLCFT